MKINRRHFVKSLAGLALVGAGVPLVRSLRKNSRPNILLLVADDMRWDAMSCMGHPFLKTPALDALAQEGLLFKENFVTTSVCAISRASIYTGDYALNHGVYDFRHALRHGTSTFMDLLREEGYYTGFIGKWGLGSSYPKDRFDYWKGYLGHGTYWHGHHHLTDQQTGYATDFFNRMPAGKPFALIVAYKAPHSPYEPANRFASLFHDAEPERAESDTKEEWEKLPKALKTSGPRAEYKSNLSTLENFRRQARNYWRLIAGVDESVQEIVEKLKAHSRYDETSVYFTSDNGFMLGEHQLMGKACMYEESIRTPLIIKPSRLLHDLPMGDDVTQRLTLNIDLAATILSQGGASRPEIDGRDIFMKGASDWRQGFYYEFQLPNAFRCEGYRDKQYKYTLYYGLDRKVSEAVMYDLQKDPLERSPLKEELHSDLYAHYKELMLQEKTKIIR